MGKEAAINAAAATSTLTGGYGNSYAGTAAAQANQQYLTQLNEKIPELYNAALNKYNMETEDMYNKFNLVQGEENRLYGQYRDTVSDYYSDLSDLRSGHSTAQAQENADREFNYRTERDAISDAQWQKQFDYNVSRDSVSDSQWQKQFDTSNSQWQSQFDYQKERDAVADSQWEKEYQLALKKAKSGGNGSKSNDSENSKAIPNASTQRSVEYGEEKISTIAKAASRSGDKVGYMMDYMLNNPAFTLGDFYYTMQKLGYKDWQIDNMFK